MCCLLFSEKKDALCFLFRYFLSIIRITLKNVKCSTCTISISKGDMTTQLDDTTEFSIKLKKDDKTSELIADNKIISKSCEDGIIISLSNLDLKTGYEYQISLEVGDNGEKYESNSFKLQGIFFNIYIK